MFDTGTILAIVGAIFAAFVAGIGSSIGVFMTGSKAAGVLAEKPYLFGKVLVITSLPGSQGVYGLLIAILTLSKIKFFGAEVVEVSKDAGFQFLWAGILMGLAGFSSAWFQARVAVAGLGAVAKEESLAGKAIVLAVIIETYAIFGLLISLLIVNSVKL